MNPIKILIVEDEHVVALDLQSSLETLGYKVVAYAATGEEAIRLVDSASPDVVLMDIHLQGTIDGIEAYSRIRARHNLPVIYLTAYSDPDTLERAKITEPFGYILKPFELRELRTTIEMALHKYGLEKKIVESERKFRELTDLLPQTVFEADVDGNLTFVNQHGLEWFEYSEEDLASGLTIFQMIVPGERETARQRLASLPSTERWSREQTMLKHSGSQFPAIIYLSKVIREHKLIGLRGLVVDISELKSSQDALRQSQQKLSLHVQQTALGAIEWDKSFRVTDWNPAAEQIFGYSRSEAMAASGADLIVPDQAKPFVDTVWNDLLACRGGAAASNVNRRKDGAIIECDWFNTPLIDDKGNVIGVASLVQDVTERKRVQENLRDSEERLKLITESVHEAIFVVDEEGRVTFWNAAAETIFGYARQEVMGQHLYPLIVPARYDNDFVNAFALRNHRNGDQEGARRMEIPSRRRDGAELVAELSIAPIRIKGKPHVVGILRDITERKAADEALARYTEELLDAKSKAEDQTQLLEIQAIELREAREAALEVSRLKSEFVANMSHEIRTPMNGVIGMTALLMETPLSTEQKECVQIIHKSGESLLRVINDILDFSKIESGKVDFEKRGFDLQTLVEEAMGLHTLRAQQKGLELAYLVNREVPRDVRGDPGRISQALANLVGNAIKFTDRGEVVVRVSLDRDDGSAALVRFTVADTGIGISEEESVKLFQPFTQADGSVTRKYGGTGLGLTITKRLVELMGGTIGFESEKEKGSTFWFTIPFEKEARARGKEATDISGFRGLVVDDNETNRDILSQMLLTWGIRAHTVENGHEALRLLKQCHATDPFDFVILDMQMEGMDGLSLAGYIKSDPSLSNTRLMMLSSLGSVKPATYIASGIEALLTKPVKQSTLYDTLVHLLNKDTLQTGAAGPFPAPMRPAAEELTPQFNARVLVAEDNEVNQEVARRMLMKLGCAVDIAADGAEAVRKTGDQKYDIVFMDCHMPVMDGYSATRTMKSRDEAAEGTIVVAMTANALRGDKEECFAAGMDDYIAKPVKMSDLAAVLRKWYKKEQGESLPAERIDGPSSQEVRTGLDRGRIERLKALVDEGEDQWWNTLIQKFLTGAKVKLDEIAEAVKGGDTAALRTLAHTLKGSSFNMGAAGMVQLCKNLEAAAEQHSLEVSKRWLADLLQEFEVVRTDLEKEIVVPKESQ
jgi:PAS domain S-box-containing protein